MQHDIRHGLPKEAALTVAQKALESYAARFADYSFAHQWTNESRLELSFAVMGKRLQGSLTVLPDVFRFEIEVPFAFKIFSGQAVKIIEKETVQWLEKAKSGELVTGSAAT